MKFSVVIPARNEAGNIGVTINRIVETLQKEGIYYEIVVVDDGSTDNTVEEIKACCTADPNVRLVQNTGKHGFGRAVRCGLDVFTGDAVAIVMADSSDDPDDLVRYFHILSNEAECAFGSRFIKGSRVEGYPRFKLLVNRLANLFIRILFGVKYNDLTNAFKAYRASVIQGCRPFISPHFNLTVEIPLKAIVRGYSYAVVPINWYNRKIGDSSLRIKEMGSRYLFIVLYIWLEKMLTKSDYRRPLEEVFEPWPDKSPAAREEE
ncbi:glycosyltransferase family 2 protein [Candidatus Poribacteria bacterium]